MAEMNKKRTYSELMLIKDYYDRFEYLKIGGKIGFVTFGYDRWLNQIFYTSNEWKEFRRPIIIRDKGLDMGSIGHDINDRLIVHHINPITKDDILNRNQNLFDPENVICVSDLTHKAIHFANKNLLPKPLIIRSKNDTSPWKK